MIKLLSVSGSRAAKRKGASADHVKAPVEETDSEKVIDFETLLAWSKERELNEAAGNDRASVQIYAQKKKGLKFLTL
jgi:hypothetical protein